MAKIPLLLYCVDDGLLAVIAYALRVHAYDVSVFRATKEVLNASEAKDISFACGVIVHSQRGDPAGRLIHRLLEGGSRIPLLMVDHIGDLAPVRYADMVLYGQNTKMVHILTAIDALRHGRQRHESGSAG